MNRFSRWLVIVLLCGCTPAPQNQPAAVAKVDINVKVPYRDVSLSKEQEAEIRGLIEQLVFAAGAATNRLMRNPHMKIFDADGNEVKPGGGDADDHRRRFDACTAAFVKLAEFKLAAFPIMVEHLDDDRQSLNFRNHHVGNSVGDACYWNIYYQLQDRPENYSQYGYSRTGRDGKDHPKPYWEGEPFDEAGGLKQWLEANQDLNYTQMQIKCLQWLLDREKKIGAPDADSYFLNILPLEIRILERRLELGEDVGAELERLRKGSNERDESVVPRELLPGAV